ncbi:MAG TPA: hypothetical protein VMG08_04565 [Allosphingosinicella sp.]|nr:hypothetical protein [Allosphingosinicella sp.]
MNFYLPDPRLDANAEVMLAMMQERLAAHGRAFTGRRIRALIWDDGEQDEIILVGASVRDCQDGRDCPVLLILEDAGEPDLVHVVTLCDMLTEKPPRAIRLDSFWRIVDFDDSTSAGGGDEPRRVRV